MIVGIVQEREALIRLTVHGFRGRQQEIEAVIDSGYTGWLTPLVGMALLRGYEYKMQVRARGKVTIKRLPQR